MADATRERRRLRELTLTGARRAIRQGLLGIIGLAALISAVGFAIGFERARTVWEDVGPWKAWHSFAWEGFGVPVVAPALVAAAARWARRGGIPRGVLTFLIVLADVVALAILAIGTHLFEQVEGTLPEQLAVYAQIAMVIAALALALAEPLAFVLERRRLERGDPVVATARVVTRRRGAG